MGDFFAFRKFITPVFIQVIFWIGVAGIILGLFIAGIRLMSFGGNAVVIGLLEIIIGIPLALIFWRVWCEIVLVAFRMLEALRSIDQKTR